MLALAALWPLQQSSAQTYPPNDAGVSLGQFYTIVRDVDATKKFWGGYGGKEMKIDGVDVMKFPGVLVFLSPGTPSARSLSLPTA